MSSQRQLFTALWGLLAGLGVMSAAFLWLSHQAGPQALVAEARLRATQSCQELAEEYGRLAPNTQAPEPGLLSLMTESVLGDWPGVEGGIWHPQQGFVAYAFPTHDGAARKLAVPEAELPTLRALVERVRPTTPLNEEVRQGRQDVLALAARSLPDGMVAWTMIRVRITYAQSLQRFAQASAVALVLALGTGVWLLARMRRWSRHLARLEQALQQRSDPAATLPATGEADLDRLVDAFNVSARQLAALGQERERLAGELARAERLAALGRLAAGLAHEIKNPLGAMRLRVENALAQSDGPAAAQRRQGALEAVQRLIARLDRLVGSLMAMSQPLRIAEAGVEVGPWLRQIIEERQDLAASRSITLSLSLDPALAGRVWPMDPEALGRAVDNLVHNALQHTPSGGRVTVQAITNGKTLLIRVDDSGPGVPAELRPRLFEPFVTGSPGGHGLGLAIASEIALAHGGRLRLADCPPETGGGARFELEVPWPKS
jgi:signal transduction histidine kinase